MRVLFLLLALGVLAPACSNQSNNQAPQRQEEVDRGDVVPDDAAKTPQNQNHQKNPKIISF